MGLSEAERFIGGIGYWRDRYRSFGFDMVEIDGEIDIELTKFGYR